MLHGNHHDDSTTCYIEKKVVSMLKLEHSILANGVSDKKILALLTIRSCHHHDYVDIEEVWTIDKRNIRDCMVVAIMLHNTCDVTQIDYMQTQISRLFPHVSKD